MNIEPPIQMRRQRERPPYFTMPTLWNPIEATAHRRRRRRSGLRQ